MALLHSCLLCVAAQVDLELDGDEPGSNAQPSLYGDDTGGSPYLSADEAAGGNELLPVLISAPSSSVPGQGRHLLHNCRPTDLLLLCSQGIEAAEELEGREILHALGILNSPVDDQEQGAGIFRATVFAPEGSVLRQGLLAQDARNVRGWSALLVGSTATSSRVWTALQALLRATEEPSQLPSPGRLLQQVLHGPAAAPPCMQPSPALVSEVQRYCSSRWLNDSQAEAVQQVAAAAALPGAIAAITGYSILGSGGPRYINGGGGNGGGSWAGGFDEDGGAPAASRLLLVQGPLGTGKTATIVQALLVLAGCGCRTLVCAPTNVAVQGVAERLLTQLAAGGNNSGGGGVQPWFQAAGEPPLEPWAVALVASADRVEKDGPMAAIHLPARAARLRRVLSGEAEQRLMELLAYPLGRWKAKQQADDKQLQEDAEMRQGRGQGQRQGQGLGPRPQQLQQQVWQKLQPRQAAQEFKEWLVR